MASAEPVTRQQAQERAQAFLEENGKTLTTQAVRLAPTRKQAAAQTAAAYYVFNVEADGGFVVVSGDDRTVPILGYSDRGAFDEDDMPENLRGWLEECERQIAYVQEHDLTPGSSLIAKAPAKVKAAVAPLLTSTWGQGTPFNNSCPLYNGGHCVTGCVATAMAQLMYYYKYPAKTKAEIPAFTTYSLGISVPAIGISTIDWGNMLPNYLGAETTDVQQQAVADLMAMCGSSVAMDFTPGASGAMNNAVPEAMVKYFGYDKGLRHLFRSAFSKEEWEGMVYDEIANAHPVLYFGQSAGGGHAFIIDGSDERGYFHVNWGWNGRSDGFFLLSILNPYNNTDIGSSSSADGFSFDQFMIVDIRPDEGGTPDRVLSIYSISADQTTFTRASAADAFNDIILSYQLMNNGTTGDFDLGLGIFDQAGDVKEEFYVGSIRLDKPGMSTMVNHSAGFGNGLPDGTYRIKALSRAYQSSAWFVDYGSNTCYLTATINGNTLTLADPVTRLAGNISLASKAEVGVTTTATAHITNTGTDFNGDLFLFIDGHFSYAHDFEVTAGATADWSFEFMSTEPGEHTLSVATGMRWDNEAYEYVAENVVASTTIQIDGMTLETDLVVVNGTSDFKLEGTTVRFRATVKNTSSGTFDNTASLELCRKVGGLTYIRNQNKDITLAPQESQVLEFVFDDLMVGESYYGLIKYHTSDNIWNNEATTQLFTVVPVSPTIQFADAEAKRICVGKWDANGDGELSEVEAAAVSDIGLTFYGSSIASFDEFAYFVGLESIPTTAFHRCPNLTSVVIPKGLKSLGEYNPFANSPAMVSVRVDEGNTTYDSRDNCNAIIETATGKLVTGIQTTTIPATTTAIGVIAFAGSSEMTAIDIPDGVKSIGRQAFWDCRKLQSIHIPASVTSIDKEVFVNSWNLAKMSVDAANPVYDSRENCNAIIETATNTLIEGCNGTVVPPSVEHIGECAFGARQMLAGITLPARLLSIGANAFWLCHSMTRVKIPASVRTIGEYAFEDCTDVTEFYSYIQSPFPVADNVFGMNYAQGQPVDNYFSTATLYVPRGTREAYRNADGWRNFQRIEEKLYGDVNGDDSVTIADAVAIINRLTAHSEEPFDETAADANGDGRIDFADVLTIVSTILNSAP